jgi:hypothetical protein
MYKIIGADGNEYGPVSTEQIQQWLAEGRLNAVSRIQREGSGEWKLLHEMPEFALAAPPPPPLRPAPINLQPVAVSPTNPLAAWSLGTGIAAILPCCCWTVVLPATSIALGAIALSQIKQNPNQAGRSMAVAGIVLGSLALLSGLIFWIVAILNPIDPSQFPRGFPFPR